MLGRRQCRCVCCERRSPIKRRLTKYSCYSLSLHMLRSKLRAKIKTQKNYCNTHNRSKNRLWKRAERSNRVVLWGFDRNCSNISQNCRSWVWTSTCLSRKKRWDYFQSHRNKIKLETKPPPASSTPPKKTFSKLVFLRITVPLQVLSKTRRRPALLLRQYRWNWRRWSQKGKEIRRRIGVGRYRCLLLKLCCRIRTNQSQWICLWMKGSSHRLRLVCGQLPWVPWRSWIMNRLVLLECSIHLIANPWRGLVPRQPNQTTPEMSFKKRIASQSYSHQTKQWQTNRQTQPCKLPPTKAIELLSSLLSPLLSHFSQATEKTPVTKSDQWSYP